MSFLPKSILKISTLAVIFSLGLSGRSSDKATEEDAPMSLTEWLDAEYEEQRCAHP